MKEICGYIGEAPVFHGDKLIVFDPWASREREAVAFFSKSYTHRNIKRGRITVRFEGYFYDSGDCHVPDNGRCTRSFEAEDFEELFI